MSDDLARAEEIAKGLGFAQSRAIKAIGTDYQTPPRGNAQWLGGMSKLLVEWRYHGAGQRLYRLTPLGLAVREILLRDA